MSIPGGFDGEDMGLEVGRLAAKAWRDRVGAMRRMQLPMAGIATAGLVAASLVMGAPASATTVTGTGGDDQLRGTPYSDTIRGFAGDDRVFSLAGPDLIFGGSGRDFVRAGRGDETIRGGPQGDVLHGARGADTIYAGAGRDTIFGNAGSDVIFGGKLGDWIRDGLGPDTIHGGLGPDTVYLQKGGGSDTVTCGSGHDVVWGASRRNTVAADCEEVHVVSVCGCLLVSASPPAAAGGQRVRAASGSGQLVLAGDLARYRVQGEQQPYVSARLDAIGVHGECPEDVHG